jgi:hypothetical protein
MGLCIVFNPSADSISKTRDLGAGIKIKAGSAVTHIRGLVTLLLFKYFLDSLSLSNMSLVRLKINLANELRIEFLK